MLAELALRKTGSEPGLVVEVAPFESKTDSLILYPDYVADEKGITKISPEIREFVNGEISKGSYYEEHRDYRITKLISDYVDFNNGKVDNPFAAFIAALKQQRAGQLDAVDSAYLAYVSSPINSDGFRSIAFKNYKTDKLKVLLLGDSFTYGSETTNITYSFADHLSARGLVVYNSGIIATDPPQYLAVAQKYIPELKPDVVVVCFAMANDIMYFHRHVQPFQPVIYATNAGLIFSCLHGEYRTFNETYDYILNDCYIHNQEHNLFNRLSAKTVLTTKLWITLEKMGVIKPDEEKMKYLQRVQAMESDLPVTDEYIRGIMDLCREYQVKFLLAPIPFNEKPELRPKDVPGLFVNIPYHVIETTTQEDRAQGGHFNDRGYEKYGEFLLNLIDSITAR